MSTATHTDTIREAHGHAITALQLDDNAAFWRAEAAFGAALDALEADHRTELVALALWLSPVWEDDNKDDGGAAERAVDEFLAGRSVLPQPPTPPGGENMTDPYPNIRAALWADNPSPEIIEAARREHGEAMRAERELQGWQRAYDRASNQVAAHNMAIDDGDDYGEHVGLQRHRRAVQTGHEEALRFFSAEERARPDAPLPTGELLRREPAAQPATPEGSHDA